MTTAYPLSWPDGWQRSTYRQRSIFKNTSVWKGIIEVTNELRRLNARNVVISTNVELRNDGLPRSDRRPPQDPGVAVYFTLNGREQCIPCDKWNKVEDNLHAVGKTIEALRGIERWGAKSMVDAAFRGFQALPPPDGEPGQWVGVQRAKRKPREVLGLAEGNNDPAYAEFLYKRKAKELHPDSGGSHEEMQELNEAWSELKKELGI